MYSKPVDSFDLAILEILQTDCTLPHRVIGERVNLSTASVQRRIRRMESEGTILGQMAQVDPKAVGLPLTIVVEVALKSEAAGRTEEIKRIFRDAQEVQQCYYVTGEVDFVLIVMVGDMEEYEDLTHRLFFANENIEKFKSFVAMDRTKATMRVNIPALENGS